MTLTNNGGLPLLITSLASSGDFGMVSGSTCGTTLAAGGACTMLVVFTPTTGGARTGTLTVTSNAPNSPQTLAISGAGVDFALTPNGSTSVTVPSGQVAGYPMVLSSVAGVPGTATLTCLGLPANTTCTLSPSTASLGGSTQILVNIATGVAATASVRRPAIFGWQSSAVLASLLPLGLLAGRRRRRRMLAPLLCALIAVATLSLSGCGGSRAIPSDGSGSGSGSGGTGSTAPTPTGTYTVTVSAASAGLTRSVQLTLVVQ